MDMNQLKGGPSFEEEAQAVKGAEIELVFQLPDSSTFPLKFTKGVDVNWLRYQVATYLNVSLETIDLQLSGKKMLGPLSLEDYPTIQSGTVIDVIFNEDAE